MKATGGLTESKQGQPALSAGEQSVLLQPIANIMQSSVLRCDQHTPTGLALSQMQQRAVGSMLIDCDDGSIGILTRSDLIARVILPQLALDTPVGQVMTHPVHCLPLESSVLDAMQAMLRWRLRHLPIQSGAVVVGLVSEHDLMLQHIYRPDRWMIMIEQADSEERLIEAANRVSAIARRLQREHVSSLQMARTMSLLNDALTRRAIALVLGLQTQDLEQSRDWAWIALGSEARAEQTVVTDQDNALIVRDEAMIPKWLEHAKAINQLLDRMGFPLCKGGVMAMNEAWCKSLNAWLTEARGWFDHPSPQSMLKAQIVLDFRLMAGDQSLVDAFEQSLSAMFSHQSKQATVSVQTAKRQAFLHQLAADVLERSVQTIPGPWKIEVFRLLKKLGWVDGLKRDLKLQGSALIVDAVRLLVLTKLKPGMWMPHSTYDRLQWLALHQGLDRDEVTSLTEAFEAITGLRFQQQLEAQAHTPGHGPNEIELLSLDNSRLWLLRHHVEHIAGLRTRLSMDLMS